MKTFLINLFSIFITSAYEKDFSRQLPIISPSDVHVGLEWKEWGPRCKSSYAGNTGIKVPGEDLGWVGQNMMVLPDIDLVLVITGANYTSRVHQLEILERFILSAIFKEET